MVTDQAYFLIFASDRINNIPLLKMRSFLLAALLLLCFFTYGQTQIYSPRILFLTPQIDYDPRFEQEMQEIGKELTTYFPGEDTKEQPKNIQQTVNGLSQYARTVKASGIVPLIICQRMLFTMFRGQRNFIVLMDTLSVYGTADELRRIADERDVQHIVFFPEVRLYYEDTVGFGSMKMAVYDRNTNKISLEFENNEDWFVEEYENPELCDSRTATCLLFNSSYFSWFRILETLWETNPDLVERVRAAREKHEEESFGDPVEDPFFEWEDLASHKQAVFDRIAEDYFHKTPDTVRLASLLTTAKSPFSNKNVFQTFFSPDSTQFVALVMEPGIGKHKLPRYTSPVEDDAARFRPSGLKSQDSASDFTGSVILGIRVDSTWYTDQRAYNEFRSRTEAEARLLFLYNLYYWNFFDYGSTTLSDRLWSTEETENERWLFASIEKPMHADAISYPYLGLKAWDKRRPERTSFNYLTTVEANHIVREMAAFEHDFTINRLLQEQNRIGNVDADPFLVYTGMRDIVLYPTVFRNEHGQQQLRYFVFLENDTTVYEWTYFQPKTLSNRGLIMQTAQEQLNTLSAFFLEPYPIIRDQRFWDRYIRAKDGVGYRYLKPLR